MNAKKNMTGIVGGLAVLLAATSSYAGFLACTSGTIESVGAGYLAGKNYQLTVTCADSTGWTLGATSLKFSIYPNWTESILPMDGMYATALTAVATGKGVAFDLYTSKASSTDPKDYYLVSITVKK